MHEAGMMRRAQVHGNGPVLDDEILADPEVQAAIRDEGSLQRSLAITNVDRAAFGRIGGAVARLHGDSGFAGSLSFDIQVGPAPHICVCLELAPAPVGREIN
jgi:glutamate synthase (ferredoxin)